MAYATADYQTIYLRRVSEALDFMRLLKAFHEVKTAELEYKRAVNQCRPSVILEAELNESLDPEGNTFYVASYGELFAEPGDSPEIAFSNFDREWAIGKDGYE